MNRLLVALMRPAIRVGTLRIEKPGSEPAVLGEAAPEARLRVVEPRGLRRLLRGGVLGFAEAYIEGWLDTDDLPGFLRWGVANNDALQRSRTGRMLRPLRRLWQRLARSQRHERVETMVDHYNLGNDFYGRWLDDTMAYSSARYPDGVSSLANAQRAKYEAICDLADLRPGMRVLEIGCGWGGFAMHAARERGVHVTGLTIATEQASFARAGVADAGLDDLVDIRIEDFRDTEEEFDAIVSIEMIESVDETVWPPLFAAFHDRVVPGGPVVMQAITIDDALWDGYRRRRDFIQRYVFPGGQVPAARVLDELASEYGLDVERVERFGADYARTLAAWRDRFQSAWPELAADFDERFRRMWELYLGYCEAGFLSGRIDVQQWLMRRGSG